MTIGRIPSVEGGIQPTIVDAKGDLIVATAADTVSRLAVGSANQILTVDSSTSTGLKWAAPAAASFVGASVYGSGAQTLANNTWTALTWDSENFDTDAFHSTATNTSRFTVPSGKGGYYLLVGTTNWSTNATSNRAIRFYKNGSAIYQTFWEHDNQSGSYPGFSYSLITAASATDYLEMYAWQNSGGNLDMRNQYCNFQCYFLGA